MSALGFFTGAKAREKIHEKFFLVRWLVFLLNLLSAPAIFPVIGATVFFCLPESPFSNNTPAVLAWLTLLLPVLGNAWFNYIAAARKEDKSVRPQS